MIPSFIVFDVHDEPRGAFYTEEEAIRCIQLARQRRLAKKGEPWYYLKVPLCNNADRFIEALLGTSRGV